MSTEVIPVPTDSYELDKYPDLAIIWENPPAQLIVDPTSLATRMNFRMFADPNAIGIFGCTGGDEAKGKWTYELTHGRAKSGGVAIRPGGGPGAGHEAVLPDGETFVFSITPTAPDETWIKVCGRGELVKVEKLVNEVKQLRERGYRITPENLMIDGAATFTWDAHGRRDGLEEAARGRGQIGTTKQGVGPAAADYTARQDMRYGDLLLPLEEFSTKVKGEIDRQNKLLHAWGDTQGIDPDEAYRQFVEWRNLLRPYVQNTFPVVMGALRSKENVVLEGAQGFRISLDTGYRGRVTSTDSGPGPFERRYRTSRDRIGHRLGVIKIASTVVGSHLIQSPIETRLADILYKRTAERGSPEAGRVSGRKRQYYWLSIPEVRAAIDTYGLDGLLIAKMDVMDELPEIHLGMEYKFPDGSVTTDFDPDDPNMMDERTRMNTLKLNGWRQSTAGMTSFADAPLNFRAVVQTVAELTGVPIYGVGTGPKFGEAIHAENSPFQIVEV